MFSFSITPVSDSSFPYLVIFSTVTDCIAFCWTVIVQYVTFETTSGISRECFYWYYKSKGATSKSLYIVVNSVGCMIISVSTYINWNCNMKWWSTFVHKSKGTCSWYLLFGIKRSKKPPDVLSRHISTSMCHQNSLFLEWCLTAWLVPIETKRCTKTDWL